MAKKTRKESGNKPVTNAPAVVATETISVVKGNQMVSYNEIFDLPESGTNALFRALTAHQLCCSGIPGCDSQCGGQPLVFNVPTTKDGAPIELQFSFDIPFILDWNLAESEAFFVNICTQGMKQVGRAGMPGFWNGLADAYILRITDPDIASQLPRKSMIVNALDGVWMNSSAYALEEFMEIHELQARQYALSWKHGCIPADWISDHPKAKAGQPFLGGKDFVLLPLVREFAPMLVDMPDVPPPGTVPTTKPKAKKVNFPEPPAPQKVRGKGADIIDALTESGQYTVHGDPEGKEDGKVWLVPTSKYLKSWMAKNPEAALYWSSLEAQEREGVVTEGKPDPTAS